MSSAFYVKKDAFRARAPMLAAAAGGFRNCQTHLVLLTLALIVAGALYNARGDERALSSLTSYYAFAVIVPTIIAFLYVQQIPPFGGNAASAGPFYASLFLCAGFFAAFYAYRTYANTGAMVALELVANVLALAAMIGGLVIVYNMFANYIQNLQSAKYGLVITAIFYIPCLISDFIVYMTGQYRITPPVVFLLFILELILVLLIIYLPVLAKKFVAPSGLVLLREPIFLSAETAIASSATLRAKRTGVLAQDASGSASASGGTTMLIPPDGSNNELASIYGSQSLLAPGIAAPTDPHATQYLKNYTLSFWVFVNELPASDQAYSKETSIFKYEHVDADGTIHPKPKLTYDQASHSYYVYLTSYAPGKEAGARRAIALSAAGLLPGQDRVPVVRQQRWNHFAFTYNNNTADVFVNGELVHSAALGSSSDTDMPLPRYDVADVVSVGARPGLYGALCNVQFFATPLSKASVVGIYNYYSRISPPVDPA
jgi:hypothetical protein